MRRTMSQLLDRRDGRSCARTRTGAGSVARRILTLVLVAAAALVMGVLGAPVAAASAAQTSPLEVLSAESAAAVPASPLCGGTTSHGKIVFQSCIRFNCDSTGCYMRSIMGVINKASGPRTVEWQTFFGDDGHVYTDGNGQITIPAGEQRTVVGEAIHWRNCGGIPAQAAGRVKYDSTGWSHAAFSQVLNLDC
jgi:hypothetical protein